MMPFRYFLDSAYVVPNLRKRELGLPMNRRKSAIAAAVLLVHGGLIWGLVHYIAPAPPPIEFVETQVILEQVTPEQPTPTPILPSPQVQQQVTDAVAQPKQVLKVNERAVVKETIKPAAPVVAPTTPTVSPNLPVAAQPVAAAVAKPAAAPAPTGKCSQAVPLRITSDLVERNMTVRLVVRRSASSVTSANLQGSTGNSSLDALIEQRARGLRFFNKGVECDGLSFTVSVALSE